MDHRLDDDSELMIDAVRGIAALLVLVTHSFDLAVSNVFGWDFDQSPVAWRWARASIGHGGYWVWCFFMISGLCIHLSISRSVAAGNFDWRRYALARVTRIYPLFLLGLAIACVTWALHEDFGSSPDMSPWPQLFASIASLQIFTTTVPGFETSWSLSCEMIYYAAWPILLISMRGRVGSAALLAMAGAFTSMLVIWVTWRTLHKLEHSAAVDGLWTVTVLFPVWVCGAWLAGHWHAISSRITPRLWVGSIILCAFSEMLLVYLKFHSYPGWAVHLASWSSIPGLLLFLAGARHARLTGYSWSRPVCRWLGQFSYPCYILHMQLLLIVRHFLVPLMPKFISANPVLEAVVLLAPVLVTLAFAGPRLERGIMRWRAQVLARTAPRTSTVSAQPPCADL